MGARALVFHFLQREWVRVLMQTLTEAQAEAIVSRRTFGYARLRMLPKRGGVRLITNLSKRRRVVSIACTLPCLIYQG